MWIVRFGELTMLQFSWLTFTVNAVYYLETPNYLHPASSYLHSKCPPSPPTLNNPLHFQNPYSLLLTLVNECITVWLHNLDHACAHECICMSNAKQNRVRNVNEETPCITLGHFLQSTKHPMSLPLPSVVFLSIVRVLRVWWCACVKGLMMCLYLPSSYAAWRFITS